MKNRILAAVAVLVVIGAGAWLLLARRGSSEPKYRKAKLEKGDVVATVTATGTLSAVTTVSVGSQVSGIIAKLHVDFNSTVKKGQALAELDPTPFQQAVDQSRANLDKAKVQLRNDEIALTPAAAEQLISSRTSTPRWRRPTRTSRPSRRYEHAAQATETNLSYTRCLAGRRGREPQLRRGQTVAARSERPRSS